LNKHQRMVLDHLMGPTGSVIFHIVLVFLLVKFLVFEVMRPSHEVEAKIMEIEEVDLDEFDKELDELPDLPEVEEAVVPEMETPPEVEEISQEEDLSRLDVLNTASPLVMRGLYSGRLSARSRRKLLDKYAGNIGELTEKAVMKALRWLKKVQKGDGSWAAKGQDKYTPGITGLGLLTFLAHGETTASEEFGRTVEKAMRYLMNVQHESGAFFDPSAKNPPPAPGKKPSKWGPNMYAPYWHAMATYAVAEAYGLMRVPELKPVVEKAVKVIVDGQQPRGGWNYNYTTEARRDTSIAGWQIQALKAASIGGSEIEGLSEAMARAVKDLLMHQSSSDGMFYYQSAENDRGRNLSNDRLRCNTGIAVLCLQLLGQGMSQETKKGLSSLRTSSCTWTGSNESWWPLYGWYYITQAKFHAGGAQWSSWNNKFAKILTSNQEPDGHWDAPSSGSDPGREDRFGPVYCTTFAALTLQVYYRFLPTYQAKAVQVQDVTAEMADDDVVIDF